MCDFFQPDGGAYDETLLGSAHAFAAGEVAGVPYERVRLDLSAGEQKSAEFRAINPMAKVPALTDGTLWTGASPARRSRAPRRSRLLEFKMIGNSEVQRDAAPLLREQFLFV
jgi:hypothetical protein